MEFARVSRRFPLDRRRVELSWSHHLVVAALDPAEADEWLDRAEAERWNVAELRGMVRSPRRLGAVLRVGWLQAVKERERIEDAARDLRPARGGRACRRSRPLRARPGGRGGVSERGGWNRVSVQRQRRRSSYVPARSSTQKRSRTTAFAAGDPYKRERFDSAQLSHLELRIR
jgi:hypothetical protein